MNATRSVIWPLVLFWYTLFLPPQVAINLAGNLIYGYRFAIIFGLPFAIQQLAKAQRKLMISDVMVSVAGSMVILSISYNNGIVAGIIKGGPIGIDIFGSYILARSSIRDVTDFKRALIWMAPVFFTAGLFVMLESVSHTLIVKPLADAVFGARNVLGTPLENYDQRLGLTRGMGSFPHPILAGLCLSLALPLYWGLNHRDHAKAPRILGLAAGAMAIFSVSSTAFVSLAISCGLLAYDALTRRVSTARWDVLLAICAIIGTVIQFTYNGGLLKFGIRFAISGGSAWFRYAEWQYGGVSVAQHPIFGIGLYEYNRPSWMLTPSIDSLWLLLAVSYGMLCCLSYFALAVLTVTNLAIASSKFETQSKIIMRSLGFCIVVLIISGFLTSYFGGVQNWLPFLAGAAVSLAEPRAGPVGRATNGLNFGKHA